MLGPDAVTDWVEVVLAREADVGRKLAAAGLGPEGHAFVWVSISSPVRVQAALDTGAGGRLPTREPVLPIGVTHVWVRSIDLRPLACLVPRRRLASAALLVVRRWPTRALTAVLTELRPRRR